MKRDAPSYHGYRFPPEIISHAVWLYHRFGVSFRDVEDLLAQRGITVSYEAIRLWCLTFGSAYARRLKRRQGRMDDTWYLDEVFVTIQGRRHYLWRAVDQDGDVIDILVQSRRDCRAATRFFRKLLKGQERQPGRLVTDKLSSYRAAHRAVMPSVACPSRIRCQAPLGAGPSPGSGRSNGHCSARDGPPCGRRRRSTACGPSTTRGCVPRCRRPDARRQAPRNGTSILESARELGIRDAQPPHRRPQPDPRGICHEIVDVVGPSGVRLRSQETTDERPLNGR